MKKNSQEKIYGDISIVNSPKSKIEITGSIPVDVFSAYRPQALKNINESISLDGFRKGKIPENVLISKVGDKTILEEMAELALGDAYPAIVLDKKLDPIGRPEIKITKLAAENALEFTISTAVMPEIALPDYKKIALGIMKDAEKNDAKIVVEEKDVTEAIDRIRRSMAERSHTHDESHEKMTKEEHDKEIEAAMPVLDDSFVQKLGKFNDVVDFKNKVKEMLLDDKKVQSKEKRRIEISDKIGEATVVEIPDILVNSEIKRIQAQFSDDIARMGIPLEDYLAHAKKSIEDIKNEWRPQAEKKAKLQIIIDKIAQIEKIKADQIAVEQEIKHILEHYKDADAERAAVYAETVLINDAVFAFLEGQK
jgi:trigger factor